MTMVTILTGNPPDLKTAQRMVGGFVEMVSLPNGDQMLVNENGLLQQLPYNEAASILACRDIVGNALVLKGSARWV